MVFMIFQTAPPVLLTPTNYRFQNQVIPPSDRLGVVYKTFTELDIVYTELQKVIEPRNPVPHFPPPPPISALLQLWVYSDFAV